MEQFKSLRAKVSKIGLSLVLSSSIFSLLLLVPLIGSFWYLPAVQAKSFAYLRTYYWQPLLLTVALGVTVSVLVLVWASCAIFCIERIRGRIRTLLLFFTPLPLIFPPYVGAIAYVDIFKSRPMLDWFGGSDVMEFLQAAFVLSLFLYPYTFLLLFNRIRLISPQQYKVLSLHTFTLLEKMRIFYIPHLKYAIFSGMLLAFLYTVADFGAVSVLRMNTLTVRIYDEFIARFNKPEASLVATSFILLFAGAFYLSRHLGRKTTLYKSNEARPLVDLPAKTNPVALTGLALLLSLSIAIPLLKILWWCFLYAVDTSPLKAIWLTAKQSLFWVSITSFGIAGLMTLIATASVFFFFALSQRKTVLQHIPYTLALILHTLPGIVVVFGITIIQQLFDRTMLLGWLFFLSGYIFRYIGIAFVTMEPIIHSISENFTRIGKVFLSSKFVFIRTITFPLTKTSVLSSGTYIFFDCIRDLPIPLLLMPLGVEMLSVRVWQTASAGLYIYAAPAMVILLLLSLVPGLIYIRSSL